MNDKRHIDAVNDIAQTATDEYLRRSSVHFLECAIHLMASHMTIEEVATLLERQAEIVREFGA